MSEDGQLEVREYGSSGPWIVMVHGGPGVWGYLAPVGRALADRFRVLEPRQRAAGGPPLTVARHVQDLHELVRSRCAPARPLLVGHSWGAMLALACAAKHSRQFSSLALIACGTFDPVSRQRLHLILEQRMSSKLRLRLDNLQHRFPNPDQCLQRKGELILPLYSYDLLPEPMEIESCDARAYQQSWEDMLRLQLEGTYPDAFSAIECPVLMLHGVADPHPGSLIRSSLLPHLPQLQYRELKQCGHYPWLEKSARKRFFKLMREWLERFSDEAG